MSEFFSRKKISSNILTLFSGAMVARGLSAVTLIVTARALGPDIFGQYATNLALARISAVLFTLGLDTWLLQSGGTDIQKIRDRSSAALFIEISLGFPWLFGLLLLSFFLNQDVFPKSILLFCAISVLFEELGNTIISSFKANLKNNISMILIALPQLILLGFTFFLIRFQITKIDTFIIARVVSMLIALILSSIIFIRFFGLFIHIQTIKLALRETKAFGVSVALGNISRQADVVIVGNYLGKGAAGIYAPAITISSTLLLLPATIYGVMLPVLSNAFNHDLSLVKSLGKKLLAFAVILGGLLTVVTYFLAEPFVTALYGPEYYSSGSILQLFSIIMLFRFISFSSAAILAAVKWQQKRVVVQFFVVSLNVILNLIVVHKFGITGVARVYVFTEVLLMLGYTGFVAVWYYRANNVPSPVVIK